MLLYICLPFSWCPLDLTWGSWKTLGPFCCLVFLYSCVYVCIYISISLYCIFMWCLFTQFPWLSCGLLHVATWISVFFSFDPFIQEAESDPDPGVRNLFASWCCSKFGRCRHPETKAGVGFQMGFHIGVGGLCGTWWKVRGAQSTSQIGKV